jgi:hypothetical protein
MHMKTFQYILLAPLLLLLTSGSALPAISYEDPADYPLMGDWRGEWVQPKKGHEKAQPAVAAQLLPVNGGTHYRVVILPELYNRAEPYLIAEVPATHQRVAVDEGGFEVVFSGAEVRGRAKLHGDLTEFVLKKVPFDSPSVGLQPPAGATVQLNGRILHHQMEMPCAAKELSIGLQDHVNIFCYCCRSPRWCRSRRSQRRSSRAKWRPNKKQLGFAGRMESAEARI